MSAELTVEDIRNIAAKLESVLHLTAPLIGIQFSDVQPEGLAQFDEPLAPIAEDGRTGRVPAGCVFWMKASEKSFTTVAQDHGNCSVGSFTHGLLSMSEIASNSDVSALLESGWVDEKAVATIPFVGRKYSYISYGPLSEGAFHPDVVLMRLNARQMMVVSDALGISIEGKPQCHIVAIAKDQNRVAASVGCALSRARTGMQPSEMTCAIPAAIFDEVATAIEKASHIDTEVAKYAAVDARRFSYN